MTYFTDGPIPDQGNGIRLYIDNEIENSSICGDSFTGHIDHRTGGGADFTDESSRQMARSSANLFRD